MGLELEKRKKRGRKLDINPGQSPASNPEEAGGPGAPGLFDASGDSRVRVLRRDERTQKFIPHGYFPPDATEENILKEFGGGTYWAQLIVTDEAGREVIKHQKQVTLPGAYRPPTGDLPGIRTEAAKPGTAPATVIAGEQNMGQMLNATMLTAFMDMVKTMKDVTNRPPPAPTGPDPVMLELLKNQSIMQMKLMELMLNGNKGDSKKDLMELMTMMKGLIAPSAAPADPAAFMKTMAESIRSMRDISEDLSPDRPEATDPMSYLPKLAEVIVEQNNMQKERTRRRPVPRPVTVAPAVAEPIEETPQVMGPAWERIIKAQGPLLLKQAQADRDPQWAAESALTLAPEALKPAITEFFNVPTPEVVGRIFTAVPAMQSYPDWTAEFAFWGRVELGFEEEPEEGEEPPEAGDGEGLPEGSVQPGQEN